MSSPTQCTTSPRILVVDDESHIARLISFFLERAGYRVDTAADGESALQHLQNEHYAAVLLDLVLPGISGMEVLRRLRGDTHYENLPVIVLSARSFEANYEELKRAGATAQCAKPIAPSLLLRKLAELGIGARV